MHILMIGQIVDCIDQEFEKFDLITSGDYWVPPRLVCI